MVLRGIIFCIPLILSSFLVLPQHFFRVDEPVRNTREILPGAYAVEEYTALLQGKNVAVVANHTSLVLRTHLVDTLLSRKINAKKIFCPEHGFRGTADAGEEVTNSMDEKSKLPLVSLYGKNYKPRKEDLAGIDVVLFDLQDVGVRCYTYISTLHYVMEACAENKIPLIVLDRSNPNGFFIDGPVLENEFRSFTGLHPVPLVYGMTIGEYAMMINGEGWLQGGVKCDLKVIKCANYTHRDLYQLPVKPSPNLPDMISVYLYPSLCLFEGTSISVGRGTDKPFQVIGHPNLQTGEYYFTPQGKPGAKNPPFKGVKCRGYDLTQFGDMFVKNYRNIYLFWLLGTYKSSPDKKKYFNSFFEKLAGTATLRKQVIEGKSEEEIRATWKPQIDQFKKIRKKYLLYPDFE
ncbi:MAG: DUF1343 domain-containing protein [Bacteroidetes bacterium]|nr:DUF1343 domain-containing protein [Bacteroidota bacterium]